MTDGASTEDGFSLALWAVNLGRPLNGLDAWAASVDERMAVAARRGADLLVMPEYAAEQWLSFKPEGLGPDREIAWMAEQAEDALRLLRPLVKRHGIGLLAGTMPWKANGGHRNRAWLLLPDGREIAQDKLCMTPGEKDPETWNLAVGDALQVVEWKGLKMATTICLDIELPALSVRLAEQEPDLVLVPSMTTSMAGYSRVFGCAKARAVELMAAVAAVGVIGSAPGSTQNPGNTSACAVFLPCEPSLGYTGVLAATEPVSKADDAGPFLVSGALPIEQIRALRNGDAEVWPGRWQADRIEFRQA